MIPHEIACSNCGTTNIKCPRIICYQGGHKIEFGEHFSQALGKIVKNERELLAEAKDLGLEPLENASLESIQRDNEYNKKKIFDTNRRKALEGLDQSFSEIWRKG